MNSSEKVRSRQETVYWGKHYLSRAEKMFSLDDSEMQQSFRYELWAFIERIESRWLKHKAWDTFHEDLQAEIQQLYDDLCDVELALARNSSETERNRKLREKMNEAALPESNMGISRTITNWNRSPLRSSERFSQRIRVARLPEKRRV